MALARYRYGRDRDEPDLEWEEEEIGYPTHDHEEDTRTGFESRTKIGIVCAREVELNAILEALDSRRRYESSSTDSVYETNQVGYHFGRMGEHDVVVACLPEDRPGIVSAAITVQLMVMKFDSIRLVLMVGTAGGAPGAVDVRIGDIVVGSKGVVQYDLGEITPNGLEIFEVPILPPEFVLKAIDRFRSKWGSEHFGCPTGFGGESLGSDDLDAEDILFWADYPHQEGSDSNCDGSEREYQIIRSRHRPGLVPRRHRGVSRPTIHYGRVGSGNTVIKDPKTRDGINARLGRQSVLCFETEGAGLGGFQDSLVIRCVSNYCDSHENDKFQQYAARRAAAYAKELLNMIGSEDLDVPRAESPAPQNPRSRSRPEGYRQHMRRRRIRTYGQDYEYEYGNEDGEYFYDSDEGCDDTGGDVHTNGLVYNGSDEGELDHRYLHR
ncbi:hypothetical protein TWF481_010703 [Arthrobotrys musiformis]|uniref:Nucleoside phosphorylase domain-containing protein n=1 Tax=Arthrobotrys musiformis TaxID=47236 RepID=A0AAV9W2X8_9PEZI